MKLQTESGNMKLGTESGKIYLSTDSRSSILQIWRFGQETGNLNSHRGESLRRTELNSKYQRHTDPLSSLDSCGHVDDACCVWTSASGQLLRTRSDVSHALVIPEVYISHCNCPM